MGQTVPISHRKTRKATRSKQPTWRIERSAPRALEPVYGPAQPLAAFPAPTTRCPPRGPHHLQQPNPHPHHDGRGRSSSTARRLPGQPNTPWETPVSHLVPSDAFPDTKSDASLRIGSHREKLRFYGVVMLSTDTYRRCFLDNTQKVHINQLEMISLRPLPPWEIRHLTTSPISTG
jgi:hypothetical protein